MAVVLNNVTTTDNQSDNEIQTPNAVGLSVLVANKAVLAAFKRVPQGQSNESAWTDDLLLTPQTAQYHNVSGFRVKSAIPGVPAQVVAVLSEPSDPQALGASPYTASLASSGTVTPGVQSLIFQKNGALVATESTLDFEDVANTALRFAVTDDPVNLRVKVSLPRMLAVAVNGDGSIAGGTGMTVNRTGVGVYVVTFVAFAGFPIAIATPNSTDTNVTVQIVGGGQIGVFTTTGAGATPADRGFQIIVIGQSG